jgi:hypothetical protein
MPTDKHNYFQLIKANQWASRVFIGGNPITITIQDVFTKDGEEFTTFVDQNNEKRTLRSDLIEVPTFTMD